MPHTNPLLTATDLPDYPAIKPQHVLPAVTVAVANHARAMRDCAGMAGDPALLLAKDLADAELTRVWGVVGHLQGVTNSPELREAHAQAQPIIDAHYSAVGQDKALYQALAAIDPAALDDASRRALMLVLREFELSGVALDGDSAARFTENSMARSRLATEFSNAVLDATQGWQLDVTDAARLAGIPDADQRNMAEAARAAGVAGWRLSLQAPCVMAVLTHAQDRDLRREVYTAYNTRASDQGPQAGQFDNTGRMRELLALRGNSALMLGYDDPVAVSLASKMARDGDEVEAFLTGLAATARPQAEKDLASLRAFAARELGITDLQAWDIGYASEHMRRALHAVDSAEIRQHLPLDRVLAALFGLVHELFGVELREAQAPKWHADVRHFTLHRPDSAQPVAALYTDFFAREGKRGGAWMDVCRPRGKGGAVWPVAYLVTNFSPPAPAISPGTPGQTATITHDDMVTLFHEMGHCLHHLLSPVDVPSVAGISGVEWDAVELPSQFLENFAWEPATLRAASAHGETGAPLSDALIGRMLGAKRFLSAMALLRQTEFALYDLRLHRGAGGGNVPDPQAVLDAVRAEVAVIDYPVWHRFGHAFSHIFSGGYAAGYYSYLWAERLSADAYGAFEEAGADRAALGARFRDEVLARGGSRAAIDNFIAFRGREPDNGALLKSWGISG